MKLIMPGAIKGAISAPSSKSFTQRAIIASLLSNGESKVISPSFSEDGLVALELAKCFGAKILVEEDKLKITGSRNVVSPILNCKESGFCLRAFAGIAALCDKTITLTSEGSLVRRPIDFIVEPLRSLGAEAVVKNDFLTVKGPMKGGSLSIDGSISSQFLSGLLMTLPLCKQDSKLIVRNLTSTPYIKMTLSVLKDFGVQIEVDDRFENFILPGKQSYKTIDYSVEGDWSGAAFFLVLGAVVGSVTVKNLRTETLQADSAILNALMNCGASVTVQDDLVHVEHRSLNCFYFDASDCPDLFPPLVALAVSCKGESKIRGVSRLSFKESDRGRVLASEFSKLGARISISDDIMIVSGSKLNGGTVSSNNDHRIAMALSVAAKSAKAPVKIINPLCVNKSYPAFFEDFKALEIF